MKTSENQRFPEFFSLGGGEWGVGWEMAIDLKAGKLPGEEVFSVNMEYELNFFCHDRDSILTTSIEDS